MGKDKMLEEFYNYKDWRIVQRKQLTIISNIFFTFNVGVIGYILNYLIKSEIENSILQNLFLFAMFLFVFSIILYVIFNVVRLTDYRKTAKLIKQQKAYKVIGVKTSCLGYSVWILFYTQIGLSILGLAFTLFTFYQILF